MIFGSTDVYKKDLADRISYRPFRTAWRIREHIIEAVEER
jgi:hypothetical protein